MESPPENRKKILVVDDEPDVLKFVKLRLESQGYEVYTAENGETAIHVTKKIRPDLILLDIKLPLFDGYEVLRRVRGDPELSETPIVLATADASVRVQEGSKLLDANSYLMKPFDSEEMFKVISRELRKKESKGIHPQP
ncbi:MAG TPA: response regulator [Verrucomicrobiae bacterium]|jgi:CheY-like chemotaxis protein|nr:response regulator [Verrucomicrobiae bacterium]